MSIPNLECKLPYNKNNLSYIDVNNRINVTGKNLNKVPKELYENDKSIFDKIQFFYKTIKELEGSNIDGLIDHINLLKNEVLDIKNNDNNLEKMKYNFLKKNDCSINVKDLFPCDKLLPCDIYAYFDNTHIHYYNNYINKEYTCDDCKDHIDCDDNILNN